MSQDKDEIVKMAREAGAIISPQWGIASNVGTATFERFAALCRADLVAEVERLEQWHAEMADNRNAIASERDTLKAELARVRAVEPAGYFVPEGWDALGRVTDWAQVVKNQGTPLYTTPPQPAAQGSTSAVTANAKPEKAKPYAWRNPMNGVVISNDKKERLLCVGAGYPNFSEPLYAAGQKFIKENGK